ncbi:hypothetical protein ABZ079_33360 [Streptomyces sp. NPDC006314]|uniref:hypothetical protein n=1 Tax=Streptomyces sp. NPDC006314 TaxID=3154475 RepID=UPI0033BCBAFE
MYFGGRDVIVQHDTGYGDWVITAYGRTEEALHRLADSLGLDWSKEIGEPEGHGCRRRPQCRGHAVAEVETRRSGRL